MYSFDSLIEADSSLMLLPSPLTLISNDQFRELSYDNFPWAFAISGLTIALLVSLELALERLIDDKMNHSKPEEKTTTEAEVEASGQEEQRSNEGSGEDEDDDHKVQDLELQLDNAVGKEEHHDHAHIVDKENPLASILLTIALSIHSIIEGIGVGATGDVGTITSEFIAILVHKCFTAFALGNQLISSGYWTERSKRKYFYISIGLFIGVSLLGIGIGWAIASADSSITEAIFVGITAGSFIFVAALEIIPGEARIVKQERLNIPLVVFSFIAGYILMAMLALWA